MSDKLEQELESKFNSIIASKVIVTTSKGPLWFKYPTLEDKQIAQYYYQDMYESSIKKLVPTVEQTIEEHKKNGGWSDEKEKQLEKLPTFIEQTKNEIKNTKQPSKIKKLTDWQKLLERIYLETLGAKNRMLSNTVEYVSNERSTTYLVWRCFTTIDNKPLWPTFDKMIQSSDISYINELINLYVQESMPLSEDKIRKLARQATWRVRWGVAKSDTTNLFGRSLIDATIDQFMLVYWSQVYDMVYESLERPPDRIIENDEKLDEWLNDESKKYKNEIEARFGNHGSASAKKMAQAGEIFLVVDGYFDKDGVYRYYSEEEKVQKIQEIRNRNTSAAKAIMAREEKYLEQHPDVLIQEHELRKDVRSRQIMGGNVERKIVQ